MNNKDKKPKKYDLVLGGNNPPPVDGLVLGGIEGVKKRLNSTNQRHQLTAVKEALKYGNEGVDLIFAMLENSPLEFKSQVARILRRQGDSYAKQRLLDDNPYLLFTTLHDWHHIQFNSETGIDNPEDNAYIVEIKRIQDRTIKTWYKYRHNLENFDRLLDSPQAHNIEALICEINDYGHNEFDVFMKAICEANQKLPNLKALFIGDGYDEHPYRKSKLLVSGIKPILEAYPNLEVLQVRGCLSEYNLKCEGFRHEKLKTLIIETADLSESNLKEICNLDLPALEYLEIWLGRQVTFCADYLPIDENYHDMDYVFPNLFSGDAFPHLKYLGLISSEITDLIVRRIIESPLLSRLSILDLSMGCLTDEGYYLLTQYSSKFEHLHDLNTSGNEDCEYIDWTGDKEFYVPQGCDRYSALYE